MSPAPAQGGFRAFFLIWLGQVVSLFGSQLTSFALGVWVLQETGSVTRFTLIAAIATLPGIFLSPLAGALVDRFDRRWMMILSDGGAAATTLALVALLYADSLEIWHIYVIVAISSAFNTLQFPAFLASMTLLVPREQLGRAAGMMEFGHSGAQILAPLAAGFMMLAVKIEGIIAVDFATFLFSVLMLLIVRIPRPEASAAGAAGQGSIWAEMAYGWNYIRQRPALLSLLGYFAVINFLMPAAMVLSTPLVLSFTTTEKLGMVLAASAVGGLVGGMLMGAWGGPKKKIYGILGFSPLLAAGMIVTGLSPSAVLIAIGLFAVFFVAPIINGCSQVIWQTKVEPDVQGRVFATRRMIAQMTAPLSFFLAGPLADRIFEPLLAPGGPLAGSVGAVLGTGEGRGIGFFFIVLGLVFSVAIALAFAYPRLRRIEDEIPDAISARPPGDQPPIDPPQGETP